MQMSVAVPKIISLEYVTGINQWPLRTAMHPTPTCVKKYRFSSAYRRVLGINLVLVLHML